MPKLATQLRLDETIYEKIRIIAQKELRSINSQMEYFILKGVEDFEKENPIPVDVDNIVP